LFIVLLGLMLSISAIKLNELEDNNLV